MRRLRLSVVLSLAPVLALVACSSKPIDPTAKMSPQEIYEQAHDQSENLQYAKAVELYDKLEGRAAGTPLAEQAQIEKAYAQYKNDEPAQAVATIDRYIRLHPASPVVDYALYLKGIVNFNDDKGLFSFITRQDLAERDQQAAKESFAAFKDLVTRFPNSKYTPDARARMVYIVNSLATYEVHVARYYFRRGAYLAAANRAQLAVTDYRDAPALEEALYLMMQSYDALHLPQLRDDARRVLATNYPESRYLKDPASANVNSDPWWKLW